VVVLPDPVGPVTSTIPSLLVSSRSIVPCSSASKPSDSSASTVARVFRIRMTTFSPSDAGSVEIRRSTGFPLTATRARPSWGRRRSAMSIPPMILMREISGMPAARGIFMTWRSTPSIR
jgi:hypothetical protein